MDDNFAREKTTQAFRDALSNKYKSSNEAKKMKKRALRRAASSSALLGAKSKTTESSSSGSICYSDPLIAKLRMHKAKSKATAATPRSSLLARNNKPWSRLGESCPNLGLSKSLSTTSSNITGGRNFEWGTSSCSPSAAPSISSNRNFEWGHSSLSASTSSTFDLNSIEKVSSSQPEKFFNKTSFHSVAETVAEADSSSDDSSVDLVNDLLLSDDLEQEFLPSAQEDVVVDPFDQMVDMVCDVNDNELDVHIDLDDVNIEPFPVLSDPISV